MPPEVSYSLSYFMINDSMIITKKKGEISAIM